MTDARELRLRSLQSQLVDLIEQLLDRSGSPLQRDPLLIEYANLYPMAAAIGGELSA